jgi:hypothetical protein
MVSLPVALVDIQIPVEHVSSDPSWENCNAGTPTPPYPEPRSVSGDIDAVRQDLLDRIRSEEWFVQHTKERVLDQREAFALGKRAGESVLLAFSDPSDGPLELKCCLCAHVAKTGEQVIRHMRAHFGLRPFFCGEDCQYTTWYAPLVFEGSQSSLTDTCVVISVSITRRICKTIAA